MKPFIFISLGMAVSSFYKILMCWEGGCGIMEKREQDKSSAIQDRGVRGKENTFAESVQWLSLEQLEDFKNHPFKVEMDAELFELVQSIRQEGVLVPLLARPEPAGNRYEIIAGHRRKAACRKAGVDRVPVMVVEMDDDQAVIAMVDSNLHREHIKPSEKAFAYRMRLEAMKQQGKRTDLTFRQVGKKSDNLTVEFAEVEACVAGNGKWGVRNLEQPEKINSNKELAKQAGESQRQINRYVRLTYLITKILDMVDEGKIAFTVAVELSYLKEEEQYELYVVMGKEQCTPSLSQANRLKRMSQTGKLDMDRMFSVLGEEKPNQREKLVINSSRLSSCFPKNYTNRQKVELIERLVRQWHQEQIQSECK